ncbi:MAG: hypothetical protein JW682_04075, partial [Campylobacterales bacterium]|nr:hypothetical protein [Campylobacterales bacterium]
MTLFQLFLLILAGVIFYLFFKQLFSGEHPKRGVDFEAKLPDEQIGGINRPDKTFSKPEIEPTRLEQLVQMADDAVAKGDMLEASKALQSALVLEADNVDVLQRHGYVMMQIDNLEDARESYEKIIVMDANDDSAHASLANLLHKLGEEEGAISHHLQSIALDPEYAPHHYNYANTLYDLDR